MKFLVIFLALFSFLTYAEISTEGSDSINKEWQIFRTENKNFRKEHYKRILEKRMEVAKKEYDQKIKFENEIDDLEMKIMVGKSLENKELMSQIRAKKQTHEEFFKQLRKSEIDELRSLVKNFEENMVKRREDFKRKISKIK